MKSMFSPISRLISPAVAATALAFIYGAVTANAQTLQFTRNSPLYTESYTGLAPGSSITTIGWTAAREANSNTHGQAPTGSGYTGGGNVIVNPDGERDNLRSPTFTLPDLSSSSVVYASAWIQKTTSNASGARVQLEYFESGNPKYVGGFGILDSGGGSFSLMAGGAWTHSTEKAIANHWYEMALVVQLDEVDITQSKGYLFVRDATLGDADFRLIEGLAGINMGYTETHQFSTMDRWRIEGFRNGGQIGEITLGTGSLEAIPEPGTVSLLLLSGLAVGGYRLYHRKR